MVAAQKAFSEVNAGVLPRAVANEASVEAMADQDDPQHDSQQTDAADLEVLRFFQVRHRSI